METIKRVWDKFGVGILAILLSMFSCFVGYQAGKSQAAPMVAQVIADKNKELSEKDGQISALQKDYDDLAKRRTEQISELIDQVSALNEQLEDSSNKVARSAREVVEAATKPQQE